MGDIRSIHNPWRDALLPAQYNGAQFYVEAGGPESGRPLVVHEYPKKDIPYAEDMGRRARRFSVRAYCISSSFSPDYRQPRDALRTQLETGGGGSLQLPNLSCGQVTCERYRLTETEKYGGYCTFDITFVEQGQSASNSANSGAQLMSASTAGTNAVVAQVAAGT
jgi:prophage DNA circulation protein